MRPSRRCGRGTAVEVIGTNIFLAGLLNADGEAAFLVTKNKKHFPKEAPSITIVNVREFLREIEKQRKVR